MYLIDTDVLILSLRAHEGIAARLVTNNEKHFARIPGLHLENWVKPQDLNDRRRTLARPQTDDPAGSTVPLSRHALRMGSRLEAANPGFVVRFRPGPAER